MIVAHAVTDTAKFCASIKQLLGVQIQAAKSVEDSSYQK